ncbi:tripartite tricarboxylate transporter substrate binding protein [Bosea caraganae]|uniref:Tripartite tricarboxylate transporter substrate binding protein n=1 Tax=Bosea caraganae TaxID=2763117 RepID=A0A370L9U1_9HYPH|nr:tripartite tricarboxylate transporter substrate binding protein [Bosea caraganae]RDJ21891.1 tripartite tricarboxylate transporter substrate binding protein [Bosea caraganae]RDJ28077.1 tripartite tricarboxylate transporter substrate binding protein [Bosea caraganae]
MKIFSVLACLAFGLVAGPATAAETFPARPIKIIVAFAAGAINDTVARLVAEQLQKTFTHGVIIENRPGAGGMTGTDFVAKAPPDGYTLLLGNDDALCVLPAVKPSSLPYDAAKDFTPLFGFAISPFAIAVREGLAAKDFAGFLQQAKANPQDIKYASTGAGGVVHVATALLEDLAGIRLSHVPYRGMAPAVGDVVGGHVDMVLVSPATIAPYVQSGKVRMLVIASETRHPDLPQVPTSAELGFPDFLVRATFGILAPRGLAPEVAQRLEAELAKVGADPAFRKRLTELGITATALSSEAYGKRISDERTRWTALAKRVNLDLNK